MDKKEYDKRLRDIHIEGYASLTALHDMLESGTFQEDVIIDTLRSWGWDVKKSMMDLDQENDTDKRAEELRATLKKIAHEMDVEDGKVKAKRIKGGDDESFGAKGYSEHA